MYNPHSLRAEEFINHAEIMDTLEYARAHKDDKTLLSEILAKAALRKGLNHREAAVLLLCEDETVTEQMNRLARQIKLDFYGSRIVIFAPLYLSNYCVNGCTYCPYHAKNKHISRKKLTQEDIRHGKSPLCRTWDTNGSPLRQARIRCTILSPTFWSASTPSITSTTKTEPSAGSM